jgi:hypothetical protein
MAKRYDSELAWHQVDAAGLSPALAKLNAKRDASLKAYTEARTGFESAFVEAARKAKMIETDDDLVFSYRFGQMSIAKVKKGESPKAKTSSKPKIRL